MERIFFSTSAGSARVEGSGLMSTLRWRFRASMRPRESLEEYFSYSVVYMTTSGPSNSMEEIFMSFGTRRLTS